MVDEIEEFTSSIPQPISSEESDDDTEDAEAEEAETFQEVIAPDDGILAIGSGGNFALAAARAMKNYAQNDMSAKEIAENALNIAADICIFTNHNIIVEEL